MVTALPGYIVDPTNPNGVVKDPNAVASMPGAVATSSTMPPQTSTSVAKPTAVVSSQTASNQVTGHITDTVNNASQDIANAAAAKVANQGKPGYTVFGEPVPGTPLPGGGADNSKPQDNSATPGTLDEPDSGNQFIYDKATGARTQVPIGSSIPPTATTTDVNNAAAADTAYTTNTAIKKFADGSYGMYDIASGKYIGQASAQNFNDAKGVQQAKADLASIKAGTYPLTPGQQAQVDNITQTYQRLIDQQVTTNANITGVTTIIQNMLGMGNNAIGIGNIQKAVGDGARKIAELNNEMIVKVAQMKDSIQKDDIDLVTKQFDQFNQAVQDKQKEIDKIETNIQKDQDKQEAANTSINESFAKKYSDTSEPILPSDTPAQRMAKLQSSPKYIQDTTIAAKLNPDETKFWADMATSGVNLSGILPNLGIGAVAAQAKLGIMQKIADNASKLGLSAQDVANSILDKKSKAATYTKLQAQGTQLAAQESKVKADFDRVKSLGGKVPDKVFQSGIPVLQNWINTGVLGTTGDPNLNNYLKQLTLTLTAMGRVVAGQTGASGTTANINTEVQGLINGGFSKEAVNSFIDSVALPDMANTVAGYNDVMKSIMGAMNVADGTLNETGGGLGLDGGSTTGSSTSDPAGLGI